MNAPTKPKRRPHLLTDQVVDLYAQVTDLLARIDALERAQPAPLLKRMRKAKPAE